MALLVVVLASWLAACSRAPERNPQDDDRTKLAQVLAADAKVDGVLAEADRLDRQGKGEAAAKLVEGDAVSALGEAKKLLAQTVPETPWGNDERAQFQKLFADREASLPKYAAALRSTTPESKLEAVVAQAALEKRALQIAASLKKEPAR
jgi:hypothetical protein